MTEKEYFESIGCNNVTGTGGLEHIRYTELPKDCIFLVADTVKTPELFRKEPVSEEKLRKAFVYFDTYKQFDKPISVVRVSSNYYIVDGYSRFFVARSLGIKIIPARLVGIQSVNSLLRSDIESLDTFLKSREDIAHHVHDEEGP